MHKNESPSDSIPTPQGAKVRQISALETSTAICLILPVLGVGLSAFSFPARWCNTGYAKTLDQTFGTNTSSLRAVGNL